MYASDGLSGRSPGRCPRSVDRSGVRQNAGTKLAVVLAVVLDERQVLHAVKRTDGIRIGHIHTV